MNFKLVTVRLIPGSFTNFLRIIDVSIFLSDSDPPYLRSEPKKVISTRTLGRNTYKITKLAKIPKTDLIVAIIEDGGA